MIVKEFNHPGAGANLEGSVSLIGLCHLSSFPSSRVGTPLPPKLRFAKLVSTMRNRYLVREKIVGWWPIVFRRSLASNAHLARQAAC
jgi:hypothetical protein